MIELGITFALITVGYLVGGAIERKHYLEIRRRESDLVVRMPTRSDRGPKLESGDTFLVAASVVVASDYFKNFVGALRNFFGGRLSTHETLLDRARREAVIRLQERAVAAGAAELVDLHIQASFIDSKGIEVSAYGTAVRR
jgi:uncharacterized protein YbjQ (UPF0145 family)